MKSKLLFFSLLAAAAFAGCSKDELDGDAGQKPVFQNDKAYMAVRIASATPTRATDGGFSYGSPEEHDITSADFYFYDKDGVFVTQANVWTGGTDGTTPNIEYLGDNVVVLKGLTGKTYPTYLVTVLNQPAGFTAGRTLKEMETILTETIHAPKADDKIKGFVMTTSSVTGAAATAAGQPVYFANKLEENNFASEPSAVTDDNRVNIYVERLAAKVTLKVDNEKLNPVETDKNIYEMKVTIAGDPNAAATGNIGAETIRVQFDGWGLNATAKKSHMMKNIDLAWSNDAELLGFAWDDSATNHRTLWGKGTAYGQALNAAGNYSDYLNYNTLNAMTAPIGGSVYCAENTNTGTNLEKHLAQGATSVLISATVLYPVKNDEGEITGWEPRNLMRYSGVLYEENHFKAYVLNNLKTVNKLNYWKQSAENEYVQLGKDDVEFENVGGMARLKLVSETGWLKKKEDGSYTDADLAELKKDFENFEANAYKNGRMYYNIPIEHLRPAASLANPKEAHYGVVRNHSYELTVNSIENLGKGVYDPGKDTIIPDDPSDPKDKYQVGVQINVLSWKIVSQSVSL